MELILSSGKAIYKFRKSTRVFSNDPLDSITSLMIQADVKAQPDSNFSVLISPNVLDFTSANLSENPEMQVEIRNITASSLGIKIVDKPDERVKVKLSDDVIKPSQQVQLNVQLENAVENEKLSKSVTLELSDPDSSRFTIPISRGNLPTKH